MLPETSSSRNGFFFFVNEKRHYWLIAAGWHAVWRWPWYLLRVPSVLREAGELSSKCSAEQELQEPHPCFFWIARWFSIDELIAEMLRSGTIQICFLWLCRRNVSAIEGRDRCDLVRSNRKLKLFYSCWEECIDFTDISRFKYISCPCQSCCEDAILSRWRLSKDQWHTSPLKKKSFEAISNWRIVLPSS